VLALGRQGAGDKHAVRHLGGDRVVRLGKYDAQARWGGRDRSPVAPRVRRLHGQHQAGTGQAVGFGQLLGLGPRWVGGVRREWGGVWVKM